MRKIVVPAKKANVRLDAFLSSWLKPEFSREALKKIILDGGVTVDGSLVSDPKKRLCFGHSVLVMLPPEIPDYLTPSSAVPIHPLFEDERFLFIDKPAGIAMHPSIGGVGDTIAHGIVSRYPELATIGDNPLRPGMAHRLDRNTSGVVVIAKTQESFTELKALFGKRGVRKKYIAAVIGAIDPPSGSVDSPIGRKTGTIRRVAVKHPESFEGSFKDAKTEYRVRERYSDIDILEVFPKTGRTHQIRVHLASIGHPVIGDRMYGGKRMQGENMPPRQLLHAAELSFEIFGTSYVVTSPLPMDFLEFLESIDGTKKAGYSGEASDE